MSEPKKHHYLSQFYLNGFTNSKTKEGKLYCYDINKKVDRVSKPLNEGYEKYFNRIESFENDTNILEKELSILETSISNTIRSIETKGALPDGEEFNELMYYIALLGVRNPAIRDTFKTFQEDEVRIIFDMLLSVEKIWEQQIEKINKENPGKFENISYKDMKEFIDSNKWEIAETNENKVLRELKAASTVFPLLLQRNWTLIKIKSSSHFFVNSDRPVKLIWSDTTNLSYGPGFGSKYSILVFPLTKEYLLWGSFNKGISKMIITDNDIASLNSFQFLYTSRFIYSPQKNFIMKNSSGKTIYSNVF